MHTYRWHKLRKQSESECYTRYTGRCECMCVCMRVCMYAFMYLCMYVCMHVCMYVCMYACVYACVYACMHVCMHACMYVCMYVCVYVLYVCMHACMCVYACALCCEIGGGTVCLLITMNNRNSIWSPSLRKQPSLGTETLSPCCEIYTYIHRLNRDCISVFVGTLFQCCWIRVTSVGPETVFQLIY